MYTERELEKYYKDEFGLSTPSPNWFDKVQNISKWKQKGEVLDIGCWHGTQLEFFLKKKGWKCSGIELNKKAADISRSKGIDVHSMSVREFFGKFKNKKWDVINVAYLLEHITDPIDFMLAIKKHIKKDGILIIEVPNEFNDFQMAYLKENKTLPYWIALPVHLNYFNKKNTERLIEKTGWKVIHGEMSFPMEMFLLMGDDYLKKPKLGKKCFNKVVKMQDTMRKYDSEFVSRLNSSLYEAGVGRSMVLYLRKSL